jgi:uncharacterized protein (DUF952 family)
MTIIYKISPRQDWLNATEAGVFTGAPVDIADGFIHFSAAHQVRETVARHFTGMRGLILAAIDADALGPRLVWEASRGGDLFPHLYGPLPMHAVTSVHDLTIGPDGKHVFPAGIADSGAAP